MATRIQGRMKPSPAQVMAVALLFFCLLSTSSMALLCKRKDSWPELLGKDGSTAKDIIRAENPYVKIVYIVPEGNSVITNFDCQRVFVWVKPNGMIYRVPKLGGISSRAVLNKEVETKEANLVTGSGSGLGPEYFSDGPWLA